MHSSRAACALPDDKEDKVQQQRRNSLRRIARWVTGLIGHADLTPSDSAIALVLAATLQRQCRKCTPAPRLAPCALLLSELGATGKRRLI